MFLLERLKNVSPRTRGFQLINSLILLVNGKKYNAIYLYEYPKCGASWVRRMLETYFEVRPYSSNRLITSKSIIQLHKLPPWKKNNSIVLFRDPRDVFVSFYFHEKRRLEEGSDTKISKYHSFCTSEDIKIDFSNYLEVKLNKITDPYFTYQDFINSWLTVKNSCYVTYEGFQKDPVAELSKVIRYLGEDVNNDKINQSVIYNTFENVTQRKFGVKRKKGEEDLSSFQRKGVSGDWVNYFNERSCQLIDEHMGDLLILLGYVENNSWVDDFCSPKTD